MFLKSSFTNVSTVLNENVLNIANRKKGGAYEK